jgi:hypothetical protein
MNKKPKYYSQFDAIWGKLPYTIDGDKDETIEHSGCGPTSIAMILATWVDAKITPIDTCKMAIAMGDRTADNGTEWEFYPHIAAKYKDKLTFKQTGSFDEAIKAIAEGAYVVTSMKDWFKPGYGHFVLLWNVNAKGQIQINDPASSAYTAKLWAKDYIKAHARQFFIFKKK